VEVVEGALHSNEMGLTGVVYVEPHMLDYIGDVRPGQGVAGLFITVLNKALKNCYCSNSPYEQ
jgi:hypothetical protein